MQASDRSTPRHGGARLRRSQQLLPGVAMDWVSYEAGCVHPTHAHDTLDVSLVLAGTVCEQVGRRAAELRALDVVVKGPGTEHGDRFGDAAVEILRLRLEPWRATELAGAPAGEGYRRLRDRRLAVQLIEIARRAPRDDLSYRPTGGDLVAEVADTLALARGVGAGRTPAPAWLREVEEAIDDGIAERLRVRQLAASVGRHPVHLARVFRRVHGVSVTGYIRRRRLQVALTAVCRSRRRLASIAAAAGFADQAHMSRCLRTELGVPPSELRALLG